MVQDGGDVVGIVQRSGFDESWQQRVGVVVVRFGSAQLGGEGPEGWRRVSGDAGLIKDGGDMLFVDAWRGRWRREDAPAGGRGR
ncbi:MAG: hypothetical protein H0V05_00475 [Euzebyaceae bacterium]|nr:hypothetical protein [Euzebyaceae bacterium]